MVEFVVSAIIIAYIGGAIGQAIINIKTHESLKEVERRVSRLENYDDED